MIDKQLLDDLKTHIEGLIPDRLESVKNQRDYIVRRIQETNKRDRVLQKKAFQDKCNNTVAEQILEHLTEYQEAVRQLEENYSDIRKIEQEISDSRENSRYPFRQINTICGSFHNIGVEVVPGRAGELEIDHEIESRYATNLYSIKATYYIDEKWHEKVFQEGLAIVDIAGKEVMTLRADEILDHELKDSGVRLFDATVGYTKVPLSVNT